jgi:hypothetical protein
MNRILLLALSLAAALGPVQPAEAKRAVKGPTPGIRSVGIQPVALKPEANKAMALAIVQDVCAPVPERAESGVAVPRQPDVGAEQPRLAKGMLTDCTVKGGEVYRSGQIGLWFVIDNTVPSFTEVRRTPTGYFAPRAWSLAEQAVGTPGLDLGAGAKNQLILPLLYPATDGDRYTIVLQHHHFEGYSGGGGSWEWGWFFGLRDAEPRVIDRYGQLPLACDQMIRACFTEEQYKRGGRCHDNFLGRLQILQATSHPWRMRWDRADLMSAPNGGAVSREQTVLRFKRDGDGRFRNDQELTSCGEYTQ